MDVSFPSGNCFLGNPFSLTWQDHFICFQENVYQIPNNGISGVCHLFFQEKIVIHEKVASWAGNSKVPQMPPPDDHRALEDSGGALCQLHSSSRRLLKRAFRVNQDGIKWISFTALSRTFLSKLPFLFAARARRTRTQWSCLVWPHWLTLKQLHCSCTISANVT